MYYLYLLSFKLLHAIGLKKSSVRLARYLEQYARHPRKDSKLYNAIWDFTLNTPAFPLCWGDHGCYFPVLSDDEVFHQKCRKAQAEEDDAFYASLEEELDVFDPDEEPYDDSFETEDSSYDFDDEDNEDPLAGDVDPTGGYYEPPLHPLEAHRLEVMRRYGDYTG